MPQEGERIVVGMLEIVENDDEGFGGDSLYSRLDRAERRARPCSSNATAGPGASTIVGASGARSGAREPICSITNGRAVRSWVSRSPKGW